VCDLEPMQLEDDVVATSAGRYEIIAPILDVKIANGGRVIDATIRAEVLAQLGEEEQDDPALPIGILPGDRYVVTDGAAKGMHGYFSRDPNGSIDGMHVGGRYAARR
jgi:hypothetical protein